MLIYLNYNGRFLPDIMPLENLIGSHKDLFLSLQINDLIVLHLGIFYLFIVRKNPSSCDDIEIRTHVPTSEGFEVTN